MNAAASESLRLFFALWPDATTRTALMRLQAGIQGRLVTYDNLHLTIAFLGQQPVTLLATLNDLLTRVPASTLTLTIDRVGYFPRNRVAWAGMHDIPPPLATLHRLLTEGLQRTGMPFRQEHDFKPHVTLARDATLPADMVFTPIVWQVGEIALVQSITEASSTRYSVLASRALEVDY
jgi:RNA 2',3'-cyclic 3'-phosphodiesterase